MSVASPHLEVCSNVSFRYWVTGSLGTFWRQVRSTDGWGPVGMIFLVRSNFLPTDGIIVKLLWNLINGFRPWDLSVTETAILVIPKTSSKKRSGWFIFISVVGSLELKCTLMELFLSSWYLGATSGQCSRTPILFGIINRILTFDRLKLYPKWDLLISAWDKFQYLKIVQKLIGIMSFYANLNLK